MVKIRSTQYPQLRVHAGTANVKFVDGAAEVSEAVAKALLAIDGIELDSAPQSTPSGEQDETSATGTQAESNTEGDTGEEPPEDDRSTWDEARLRAFAAERSIDLGKVQNLDKIRAKIDAALTA